MLPDDARNAMKKTPLMFVPMIALATEALAHADETPLAPPPRSEANVAPATPPPPSTSPASPVSPAPAVRQLTIRPTPVATVGGAKWEPGIGLVAARNDEKADGAGVAKDEPSSRAVPSLPRSSLTEIGFRVLGGFDKRAGADGLSPLAGAALRYEARRSDSLLAPWAAGGFTTTIFDATPQTEADSESGMLWDIWLRGGVDFHPLRERMIGVGPFFGYRQLHARALEKSSMLQGLDVGGQVHFRTHETSGERPGFEAIAYGFVQGAGLAEQANRTFVGLQLSTGSSFRAFANIEGCASSPDSCFPRQMRATFGLGGMF